MKPPIPLELFISVLLSFGENAIQEVLIYSRICCPQLFVGQPEGINAVNIFDRGSQVLAISIRPDDLPGIKTICLNTTDNESVIPHLEAFVTYVSIRLQSRCNRHIRPNTQVGVDASGFGGEGDVVAVAAAFFFLFNGGEGAGVLAAGGDGHGDADGGAVGCIDPRVIRDGVEERERRRGVEVGFDDAAVKGLAEAVGGYEAEAADGIFAGEAGGVVPPVHDEVAGFADAVEGGAHGVGVAVAEGLPHGRGPDEGGIADDVVGGGPGGGARVDVAFDGGAGGFVGDVAAGDGMLFLGFAVPPGEGLAGIVEDGFDAVVGDEGVAVFDVVEVADDGLGRVFGFADAEEPLEGADPEDEFGDGGGAGVEFEAEELVGIDGFAGHVEEALAFAELVEEIEDFAFDAFEVFEGDVEEVAGPAGGIEDAEGTELFMKGFEFGDGFFEVAGGGVDDGGGVDGFPVGADGFDDGGEDEAFDVGAGGVVGAEFVAFVGVEGAFEEGAEDGGFDVGPVAGGGFDEELELVAGEREGGGVGEEAAVELEDVEAEAGGEAAAVHAVPEFFDHGGEVFGGVFEALEEAGEAAAREEVDVFGEHGEEATHEKGGDGLGGVAGFFEGDGEAGEFFGDFAGDAGAAFGGVEAVGIEPDLAEAFAEVVAGEIGEEDAVGAGGGKGNVGSAGAGEFGEEFDGVADIDDDDEGRAAFVSGEGADVVFGLAFGAEHGGIPGGGTATGDAFAEFALEIAGGGGEGFGVGFGFGGGALFGFEDEGGAAVEVDAAGGFAALAVVESDGAFEDVGVAACIRGGGVGPGDVEEVAEFGEEELVVGAFGRAGVGPAGDKSRNGGGIGHGAAVITDSGRKGMKKMALGDHGAFGLWREKVPRFGKTGSKKFQGLPARPPDMREGAGGELFRG